MIPFRKMHGLGNDFVVLNGDEVEAPEPDLVRALCDRRWGVGADGVLRASKVDDRTVKMEYWNADGGVAELCGNGLRCVAQFAVDEWGYPAEFTVETLRGPLAVEVRSDEVAAQVGVVSVGPQGEVRLGGYDFTSANVGNPHVVTIGVDPERVDVESTGSFIGTHVQFPAGTNVEFAQIESDCVRMRVWERGVGETQACGTGAVAVAAVAMRDHGVPSPVAVELPGGRVEVSIDDAGVATLIGAVSTVFSGEFTPDA